MASLPLGVSRSLAIENPVWQNHQRSLLTILQPQGPATPTPSDIFVGTDTYGWPPEDDLWQFWAPAQRSNLVVILAPELINVPSIVGLSINAATALLLSVGLYGLMTGVEFSATVPAGYVISQTPVAGSNVAQASTVTYISSLGPVPTPCLPPATQQAGFGGDIWGASGGSAVPVNAYVPIAQALATAAMKANVINSQQANSIMSDLSTGAVSMDGNSCLVPTTPQVGS